MALPSPQSHLIFAQELTDAEINMISRDVCTITNKKRGRTTDKAWSVSKNNAACLLSCGIDMYVQKETETKTHKY